MTSQLLIELEEILAANNKIARVDVAVPVMSVSQDLDNVSVNINLTNGVPELTRQRAEIDGYDQHAFFLLTVNVDCSSNKLLIYDIIDEIQNNILNDTKIWGYLVNRDIVSTEYDNCSFYPKRNAVIVLEVVYRLTCD